MTPRNFSPPTCPLAGAQPRWNHGTITGYARLGDAVVERLATDLRA
ncbi:MAG: hypothetical protein ABSH48_06805 [Verrucomicrobiota bacterium]